MRPTVFLFNCELFLFSISKVPGFRIFGDGILLGVSTDLVLLVLQGGYFVGVWEDFKCFLLDFETI